MKALQNIILIIITVFLFNTIVIAQKTGNVKGKVSTSSGKKLSNVKVGVRQDGKILKHAKTDRNGKFKLTGLQAGTYDLVFEKKGYSLGVLYNVLVEERKTNNLERKTIYLTLDEGTLVIVKGIVFNQFGRSIRGAKVKVEEILRDKKPERKEVKYTSISGQFTFRLSEGAKRLRITATHKKAKSIKEIEVDEAAIYRLSLILDLPYKNKER